MEQRGGAFEMSGVDDAEVRLRVLVSYFRDQPDVVLVYLFGSHARHQARPRSDLDMAPLLLQGQVLGEGRLLYATDKAAQVEYEAHTRALYFDFQPWLRLHRDALIRAARKGPLG